MIQHGSMRLLDPEESSAIIASIFTGTPVLRKQLARLTEGELLRDIWASKEFFASSPRYGRSIVETAAALAEIAKAKARAELYEPADEYDFAAPPDIDWVAVCVVGMPARDDD